jgi:hypothetical protein
MRLFIFVTLSTTLTVQLFESKYQTIVDFAPAASDVEMSRLGRVSPTLSTHDDQSDNRISRASILDTSDNRYNLHEAIDALILFRRALRARA